MEELFSGHGWRVTLEEASLPDGRVKKIARVQRPNVVTILPFLKNGDLVLIREYRPFWGGYIWMLPTGKADKEADITEAAQRELREETGYRATTLRKLWSVNYFEALKAENVIFLAKDLRQDPLPQDAHELIEVHSMPPEAAIQKILESSHVAMPSAYALLRYLREKEEI